MKIGMISLGCAKNLVDSEMILGLLKEENHQIIDNIEICDAVIINTCGFIAESKKEAINTIFEAINTKRKDAFLIVVGCLAQRYKKTLQEQIPEIDLVISIDEYPQIGQLLNDLLKTKFPQTYNKYNRYLTSTLPVAYLKIGEGCSNCCTYCAIPLIRHTYYSFPKEDIILEAKRLINIGIREIVVIAQDTTRYGKDLYKDYFLENLLEDLAKLNREVFIRVLYLYPDRISDKLIKSFQKNHNIYPYFDIPIQHSSNTLLKSMNRTGTRDEYSEVIKKIRDAIPHAIIRTTVIVGFPGEEASDFDDLVNFVKETKFDHLGAFVFSPEEDTKAYEMDNKVSKKVANDRKKEIMRIQQKISLEKNQNHIGEVQTVLIEDFDGKVYYGRSYIHAPDAVDGYVIIKSDKNLVLGDYIRVKITNAYAYDIEGVVI